MKKIIESNKSAQEIVSELSGVREQRGQPVRAEEGDSVRLEGDSLEYQLFAHPWFSAPDPTAIDTGLETVIVFHPQTGEKEVPITSVTHVMTTQNRRFQRVRWVDGDFGESELLFIE